MKTSKCRILIMAGGTGGHIIPALAVAQLLREKNIEVHWLGTRQGLEQQLVTAANFPLQYVAVQGVRGKSVMTLLLAPFRILRAIYESVKIIKNLQPTLIIGFGGFVSGPGGVAAWLLRKPLFIHEQNSIAGFTNRCLAHLAKQTLQAFPNTFSPQRHAITTGNPVRSELANLAAPEIRFNNRTGRLRLLVLGGSQGAIVFNRVLPQTLAMLPEDQRPEVWHAAGSKYLAETQQNYKQQQITANINGFITDMSAAYSWADLVICRAGALTIAELSAVGIASLLVPFPHAVDDHQTHNAMFLVNAQAALLIPQNQLTANELVKLLQEFTTNRARLLAMAIAARRLAIPNSAQMVVDYCTKICSP